jgi:hypothetical protein
MTRETQRELQEDIKRLKDAGVAELQQRDREVFGEEPRSRHRDFLWKRVAWRLQANAEGDLTERARQRAEELANDADLRIRAPREMVQQFARPAPALTVTEQVSFHHDPRVPMPGTLLSREFRGRRVDVMVLSNGFEYGGKVYKTLSAAAKAATGTQWNGFDFFGIKKGKN